MNSRQSKAVAYLRVSTEGQALDGAGLDAQRDRIESWCVANDYELTAVHVDAGISGKGMAKRPGLMAALDEVCRMRGAAFVVYSLSRAARSTRDMLEIADRLDRAGVDLISLTEKIDTSTAAGQMVFRLLAVLAEFERDLVAERTKNALAMKKRRGECVGQVPFGYTRKGKLLFVDDRTWKTKRDIETMRSEGLSLRDIAARLTESGVSTAKGCKVWHPTTVRRVLAQAA